MQGQWLGKCEPVNNNGFAGDVIINIEKKDKHYVAAAYFNPYLQNAPGTFSRFTFPAGRNKLSLTVDLLPIHPITKIPVSWQEIK